MSRRIKAPKTTMIELINSSRPRPEIRLRSTTFEDKTKYKRSREKQSFRQELSL